MSWFIFFHFVMLRKFDDAAENMMTQQKIRQRGRNSMTRGGKYDDAAENSAMTSTLRSQYDFCI